MVSPSGKIVLYFPGLPVENICVVYCLLYCTCLGTSLAPEQVPHFPGPKPGEKAILQGSCPETEVSRQFNL